MKGRNCPIEVISQQTVRSTCTSALTLIPLYCQKQNIKIKKSLLEGKKAGDKEPSGEQVEVSPVEDVQEERPLEAQSFPQCPLG